MINGIFQASALFIGGVPDQDRGSIPLPRTAVPTAAGSTPVAVTQEDFLVSYKFTHCNRLIYMFIMSEEVESLRVCVPH